VQHALAGTGHGTFTTDGGMPDVGQTYHLKGTGTFAGLGQGKIRGSVHGPGFVVHGQGSGTLTFSAAKGSVTVQLQGMVQTGFSPRRGFHYQGVGGARAYKPLPDQGTLRLDFTASAAAHGPGSHGGTFVLRI